MKNYLIILGTGTCQIQKERMASSVLIELGETKILYDIGRGICQRIIEAGYRIGEIDHIILSHFHPDHFSDLIPFLHASSYSKKEPRTRKLNIYGPLGINKLVNGLIGLVGPDELILQKQYKVNVREVMGETLEIDGMEFTFVSLPPANNHGLRFSINDKVYAITGDSNYHPQEINFLKNVFIAIVDTGHLTDEEITDLAAKTQVKKFICSHLYRELDSKKLQRGAERRGYRGEIIIAKDLMSFDL